MFIDEITNIHLNNGTMSSKRKCKVDVTSLAVAKALENMAKSAANTIAATKGKVDLMDEDIGNRRQCFGRELCLRMLEDHQSKSSKGEVPLGNNYSDDDANIFSNAVHKFETLFLQYMQLDDHSLEFLEFLQKVQHDEVSDDPLNCFDYFPDCI